MWKTWEEDFCQLINGLYLNCDCRTEGLTHINLDGQMLVGSKIFLSKVQESD